MTRIRPNAVFIVGHSNWGKSRTLKALTDDRLLRYWTVADTEFFIRRMSNDDRPAGLVDLARRLNPRETEHVIMALCPNFDEPWAKTAVILDAVQSKGYRMWFWVMERAFRGDLTVSANEIQLLREYGTVSVIRERLPAEARARSLSAFLRQVVSER